MERWFYLLMENKGVVLSVPGYTMVTEAHVLRLDDAPSPITTHRFRRSGSSSCPAGSRAASLAHLARTVARRAERAIVTLAHQESIHPPVRVQYLNRLSDLLFVLGRHLNRCAGGSDVLWKRAKPGET